MPLYWIFRAHSFILAIPLFICLCSICRVASQLAQCQQQLKKKDAEILNFAKEVFRNKSFIQMVFVETFKIFILLRAQIEQENFLLKKDSDENRRKACRDVSIELSYNVVGSRSCSESSFCVFGSSDFSFYFCCKFCSFLLM